MEPTRPFGPGRAASATRASEALPSSIALPTSPRRGESGGDVLRVLQAAAEQCPSGVLILDDLGTLIASNHPAQAMLGYTANDLVGRTIERLVPESSRVLHTERWKRGADPHADYGVPSQQTVDARRKDGASVPVEIGVNVVDHGDTRYVVASMDDATERRNLEARLVEINDETLGFQRMMADIAARLINTEPAMLDDAI